MIPFCINDIFMLQNPKVTEKAPLPNVNDAPLLDNLIGKFIMQMTLLQWIISSKNDNC